jgi:hypothetical protein
MGVNRFANNTGTFVDPLLWWVNCPGFGRHPTQASQAQASGMIGIWG